MWRGLRNSGIKQVIAQSLSPSAHFHHSVAQMQEVRQPTVISQHIWAFMQKMTHEKKKPWEFYSHTFCSKVHIDNEAELWNSWGYCQCRPGTFMWISFYCISSEVSFTFCSWIEMKEERGELHLHVGHVSCVSCLRPCWMRGRKKKPWLSSWGNNVSELQGVFHRGR